MKSNGRHDVPDRPGGSRPVIVLVDDDPDCRLVVRDAIESSGQDVDVVEFNDGRSVLEFLSEHESATGPTVPTVVFLDVEMPGRNGFDILAEVRSKKLLDRVPVVMLSGLDDDESQVRALSLGANSYACKGTSAHELTHRVVAAANYWTQVHRPCGSAAIMDD